MCVHVHRRSPTCGSDGVLYRSRCELRAAMCTQQTRLEVRPASACKGVRPVFTPSSASASASACLLSCRAIITLSCRSRHCTHLNRTRPLLFLFSLSTFGLVALRRCACGTCERLRRPASGAQRRHWPRLRVPRGGLSSRLHLPAFRALRHLLPSAQLERHCHDNNVHKRFAISMHKFYTHTSSVSLISPRALRYRASTLTTLQ